MTAYPILTFVQSFVEFQNMDPEIQMKDYGSPAPPVASTVVGKKNYVLKVGGGKKIDRNV